MAKRARLNERRLTKRQVAELLEGGAVPRPDLDAELAEASVDVDDMRCYELPEKRILWVFQGPTATIRGKGDIYPLDYCLRFIRWARRVDADARAGRGDSGSHWRYYSKLRASLPDHVEPLIEELGHIVLGASSRLEVSYAGLDSASSYLDAIGIDRAVVEIYDHLVAYAGEVMRIRTGGEWQIHRAHGYPYVRAPKHADIMPVNVVYIEFCGVMPANLRREAANEVRRARVNGFGRE